MNADLQKRLEKIPVELPPLPVWLLWKSVPNGEGKKPKKIPHYADGKERKTTDTEEDRQRLVTLDAALSKYSRKFTGLGIALGKVPGTVLHLSGIDLDRCVDERGIAPRAKEVMAAPGEPYAEVSPSHTGIKLFGTGDIGTTKEAELEIYSAGRFFTVTGERIQGDHLTDLTAAADVARRVLLERVSRQGRGRAISKGQRNNLLASYAGSLRARNTPDEQAWELLKVRNEDCTPPLGERELRKILDSVWRYPPGFALTDTGNAERLVASYGADVRHIAGVGWATWDAHRWNTEQAEQRVMVMAKDTVRGIYAEAAQEDDEARRKRLVAHAQASESRQKREAVVALTKVESEVVDRIANYDRDPLLVGLRNGVYDLRREEFRAGRREDRITLQACVAFAAEAACPRWERFQAEIHEQDADLVAFKQRAWGYTLTGETSEQVLFMPYGEGANGKSTELGVVQTLMGEYARKVEAETLLVRDTRSASNDVARLRGARFVPTVEVEDGRRMAESLVKQLTGEDTITARFLYQEFIEFRPVCKIWLASNHKPEIMGTDYAIWRRILLIPYPVKFDGERRDPKLKERLLAELPGILNWMIAGYREWRRTGLAPPAAVLQATQEYREDMDRVGHFLKECCKHGPEVKGRTPAGQVYRCYVGWTEDNGLRPMSARRFHERMERDHKLFRVDGNRGALSDYRGLLLVDAGYADGGRRCDRGTCITCVTCTNRGKPQLCARA